MAKIWLAVLIAPLISNCAMRSEVARMAIDHNEFVAQTTNRQLLLNIVRASEREPIHYTSFSQINGQARIQGTAGLQIRFVGSGGSVSDATGSVATTGSNTASAALTDLATKSATNFTPNLGVQVNSGTDFTIAANANDEFYKGILGPLSASTVVHFLRQGYPADLLSHLVIGRLEFYAVVQRPDTTEAWREKLDGIGNSPDEADSAVKFANALKCRALDFEARAVPASRLPIRRAADLSGLAVEIVERLESPDQEPVIGREFDLVTPARTEFQIALSARDEAACQPTEKLLRVKFGEIHQSRTDYALSAPGVPAPTVAGEKNVQSADQKPQVGRLVGTPNDVARDRYAKRDVSIALGRPDGAAFDSKNYFTKQLGGGYTGNLEIQMTIRSVEGIIYYLGEYIRNTKISPKLCKVIVVNGITLPCTYTIPIIVVSNTNRFTKSQIFTDIDYREKHYTMPLSGKELNEEAGRSSQTIAIVEQLLNLHRSSKDLPSTPLVRVVN